MDEQTNEMPQIPVQRPRRKRTKLEIFKEAYLPFVIAAVAVILILVFIIGSISRAVSTKKAEKEASIAASESIAQAEAAMDQEAKSLLSKAEEFAATLDYQAAIDVLDSFRGDKTKYPEINAKRTEYAQAMSELVEYTDPAAVPHLSFQMLIADTDRAFADEEYGDAYNKNYVTTDEFEKILQQLYDNDYMLVSIHDLVVETKAEDGTSSFAAGIIRLPVGKKPIVLSQVEANYYTYMTDGDEDGLPDKDGGGFPYCLALDANGNFVSKMIDAQGNEVVGNYDFVTILESFIASHPDFSYQGARALLAVTGYDGIFGYRTNPAVRDEKGSDYYAQQLSGAQQVVDALKAAGYDLGCYSYDRISYGYADSDVVEEDLQLWSEEVAPLLGDIDVFAYPWGEDIAESIYEAYTGDKYQSLYRNGFRIFVNINNEVQAEGYLAGGYFRQARRWVTGAKMAHSGDDFTDLFDASAVLNPNRGEVPTE